MAGAAEAGRRPSGGAALGRVAAGGGGRAGGRLQVTEEGRGASPRDREAPEQHLDPNRANRRSRWEDVWVRPRPEGGDVPHALRRETGRGACQGGDK